MIVGRSPRFKLTSDGKWAFHAQVDSFSNTLARCSHAAAHESWVEHAECVRHLERGHLSQSVVMNLHSQRIQSAVRTASDTRNAV